jgi:hypothetical protein
VAWWLLHAVGDSDLGVAPKADRDQHRDQRIAALATMADPAAVLRDLAWDGRISGVVSPLGAAAQSVPDGEPARLVLVATVITKPIADALAHALTRAPGAFGRPFDSVSVVTSTGQPGTGGLIERDVAAALRPVLAKDDRDGDHALVTWGSGSTQVTLGVLDVVITAGMPWLLAAVGEAVQPDAYHLFDPTTNLSVDPLIPLLRRWHYHDQLAAMIKPDDPDELRASILEGARRWERAHMNPTTEDLRSIVVDALARGDATSGIAVRRYILSHYHDLRSDFLDLEQWAVETLRGRGRPTYEVNLGDILRTVREHVGKQHNPAELRRSLASPGGRWLASNAAQAFNDVGIRGSHKLAPPTAGAARELRGHLAEFASPRLVPATSAWFIGLAGTNPNRPDLLSTIAAHYSAGSALDDPLCAYLGLSERGDLGLRFLVLGTESHSARHAFDVAAALNGQLGADDRPLAAAGTVPDTPPDAEAAYRLLRGHFDAISDDVGEIVLVPTGLKSYVLPLIIAGHRLAAEHGLPFYLRQLTGTEMHRLPLRFGADLNLLDVAGHALSIVELDTAARLLDATSLGPDLARRIRQLTTAMFLRHIRSGWPSGFPESWPRSTRTTGLIGDRLDVWADLAANPNPVHAMRAIVGACAVIERGVRLSAETERDGKTAWKQQRKRLRDTAKTAEPARILNALFAARNTLPINHGDSLPTAGSLNALVAQALGTRNPVSPDTLIRLAADAARVHWPSGDASRRDRPSLRGLLADLSDEARKVSLEEQARLIQSAAHLRIAKTVATPRPPT